LQNIVSTENSILRSNNSLINKKVFGTYNQYVSWLLFCLKVELYVILGKNQAWKSSPSTVTCMDTRKVLDNSRDPEYKKIWRRKE
jgi:hypothetical protein